MGQDDAALRRLGVRALARYDLREPRVRTISTRTNLILRIDARPGRSRTPQRFVLRVYRPNYHTDDAIRSEQMWVNAASEATGVMMPRTVANRDGDTVTVVQSDGVTEPRRCVLTHWIEGRDRSKTLTPGVLRALGETMARLHRFSETFEPPAGFIRPRWDFQRLCGSGWERRRRVLRPHLTAPQRRFVDRLRPFLHRRLAALGESHALFGVIHSDLHPWNVLVHRGEIRVLDTEDVAWGYYAFDVAVLLYELQGFWPDRFDVLRDSFLAGYRSIRPIASEPEDLAPFYAMRTIDIAVWLVDTGQQARVARWIEFCTRALGGLVR